MFYFFEVYNKRSCHKKLYLRKQLIVLEFIFYIRLKSVNRNNPKLYHCFSVKIYHSKTISIRIVLKTKSKTYQIFKLFLFLLFSIDQLKHV